VDVEGPLPDGTLRACDAIEGAIRTRLISGR